MGLIENIDGETFDLTEIENLLNEQEEKIKELEYELSAFTPVVFQDMERGAVILYMKDYGDVE